MRGNLNGEGVRELKELLPGVRKTYLRNWVDLINQGTDVPGVEQTARSVASHLLDCGYSSNYLFTWLELAKQKALSLVEIIAKADELVNRSEETFEVCVTFISVPRRRGKTLMVMPSTWRDGVATKQWLVEHVSENVSCEQDGSFVHLIRARDHFAAVHVAQGISSRQMARVAVGLPGRKKLTPTRQTWVSGIKYPIPLEDPRRSVEVHSMARNSRLYDARIDEIAETMDAALELLALTEEAGAGAALVGAWTALEILLAEPREPRHRVPSRAGALIACSFPRAELTSLAWGYCRQSHDGDELVEKIMSVPTNKAKAFMMANALLIEPQPSFSDNADIAATMRMQQVLETPYETLKRIESYATTVIERLYRVRNMTLHAGTSRSTAALISLRAGPMLAGVAIDRIFHAMELNGTKPLELATRARLALDFLKTDDKEHVTDLLD